MRHVRLEPGGRRVGRHAVGQVARRGAADRLETQLDSLGKGHRDHAILERQVGIIDGIVLDIKLGDSERLGQPIGTDQRRAAHLAADRRLAVDRQQLVVPPHRARPRARSSSGSWSARPPS